MSENEKLDNGEAVAAEHGFKRSPRWSAVEREHKKIEPACIHCGKTEADGISIQVHHGFPFHYCIALGRPDLELDHRNLHSLCESTKTVKCDDSHLLIGHADNFKSSNLSVVEDAKGVLHGLSADDIRKHPVYIDRVTNRLKPLNEMNDDEKKALRELMDTQIPVAATSSARVLAS